MIRLALLGKNIQHSRSKEMYEKLTGKEVDYKFFDYENEGDIPFLEDLFKNSLMGLSITYPYKKYFLNKVDIEDSEVASLQAINCVKKRGHHFLATNTDFLAAKYLLQKIYSKKYQNFIILGSGNMANIFKVALSQLELSYHLFSRKKDGDLNQLQSFSLLKTLQRSQNKKNLVINTCSRHFVFRQDLGKNFGFWDMNYSFPEHQNLSQMKMKYHEGIDLLFEQAKGAMHFWFSNCETKSAWHPKL